MESVRGKAFKFGKNIDTDQIYPGRYLELVEPEDIAKHCMEGADPSFVTRMKKGDIIVAGKNFGCGSSREHAPITLISAGVGAVVAESFARIFFRNAINLALPLMVCPGIGDKVRDHDLIEVNVQEGCIHNLTSGERIQGELLSDYVLQILESGGIKPMLLERFKK